MFSTRLEQLRAQTQKTQKEFAHYLGIPRNTYTNWIRRISKPNYLALPAIAHKCGVTVDWLTGHEHFGRRVMKFREARGWSQAQFVKKFNAAHPDVRNFDECKLIDIENETMTIGEETMEAIIAFLGVSKEEFLGADVPVESQKILAPKTPAPSTHCPNCERLMAVIESQSRIIEAQTRTIETLSHKKGK